MYSKGGAPTKADRRRKERKVIEKLGREVFIDNVSVSIATYLPEKTFKLCLLGKERVGEEGISFLAELRRPEGPPNGAPYSSCERKRNP